MSAFQKWWGLLLHPISVSREEPKPKGVSEQEFTWSSSLSFPPIPHILTGCSDKDFPVCCMMIKGTEENFHGTFKYFGDEKIRANKSPDNDPAEVGDVVEQKREQEFGHQKQACLSPEQERLPGEGWCFQVSSSCFQEQQSLLRNPSVDSPFKEHESLFGQTI